MKTKDIKSLKEYLLDMDPDTEIDPNNEDKLIGYAERFGGAIIPMYENVNVFLSSNIEDIISKIGTMNPKARIADGFENTIIGYIDFDGAMLILHDKEKMINQMISEYGADVNCIEDEDYDYHTMAIENYEYNIIGAYMDGVPAFAVLDGWD